MAPVPVVPLSSSYLGSGTFIEKGFSKVKEILYTPTKTQHTRHFLGMDIGFARWDNRSRESL
jgi:hypothetical protein